LLCLLVALPRTGLGRPFAPPPPGARAERRGCGLWHPTHAPHPPRTRADSDIQRQDIHTRADPRGGAARAGSTKLRESRCVPWQTLARVRWSVWSALPLAAALEPQPASSAWTRTRCARRCRSRWTPVPHGAAGRAGGGGAWGEIVCRRPAPDADRAPCRGSVKKERFPLRTTQSLRRVHAATALGPANMWGGGSLEDTLGPWTP
jgi:hypothetical protein